MGELSKPFMTPVGVFYRSFHDTEGHAFKAAEWAVKLFGGKTTPFNTIGPTKKGFYESGILATVPEDAEWAKPPRKDTDKSWWSEPTHAYVFFDEYDAPSGLYFYKHELVMKPGRKPPFVAQISLDLA
jgi:hypothetical protein